VILVVAMAALAVAITPKASRRLAPAVRFAENGASVAACQYITVAQSENANLPAEGIRNCGGMPCTVYQSPASCLGTAGPIGSLGPLGALGMLGTNGWNPSVYMSAIGNWQSWSAQIQSKSAIPGPLSSSGPLGPNGMATLVKTNDFGANLMPFGVWTVLGPAGPLGPLGPLGPIGPMGVHGFGRDASGNYVDTSKKVVHSISFPWDANTKKTWPLYEYYTSAKAAKGVAGGLDTSFMVQANLAVGLAYVQTPDRYTITSAETQYVTVLVVPENTFDSFSVSVSTAKGKVIATAEETTFINWVQLYVPAATVLNVEVKLALTGRVSPFGFVYRLYVTGSTSIFGAPTLGAKRAKPCPQ